MKLSKVCHTYVTVNGKVEWNLTECTGPANPMPPAVPQGKPRELDIKGTKVKFINADVEWPPGTINYSSQVSKLFQDWENSTLVKLKGVPVPLKYWSQLYSGVDSEAWGTYKKSFSEWKVRFFVKFALRAYY